MSALKVAPYAATTPVVPLTPVRHHQWTVVRVHRVSSNGATTDVDPQAVRSYGPFCANCDALMSAAPEACGGTWVELERRNPAAPRS